jgi:hypothetical protein
MTRRLPLTLCVVLALVLPAACSREATESTPAPASTPHAPDPTGEWTVVAHRIPGVSAMTDADAAAWHGRVITITEDRAVSNQDTCAAIAFGHQTRPAGRFLGESYHIAPFTLGIEDSLVDVTWVSCGGTNWAAPGGVLIWTGADRVFTPWDGVFFEMRRGGE